MKIYDAKVNHLENPIGFKMNRVVFSYKIAEAEGKKQDCARILVAKDEEMKEIILDTGFKKEIDSLGYKADIKLEPRTRYYWMVEAKSDKGEEAKSQVQFFETGKINEPWSAKWISCDKSIKRLPIFSKQIELKDEVREARLYISGLGLYEASFEGEKIGEEFLAPFCNAYDKWVQYQTYDVTKNLSKSGKLSVILGDGWYKGRFGFSSLPEGEGFYGNDYKLIAELRIKYENGSEDLIVTDESWEVSRSNITFTSIYDGEHVDETLKKLPTEAAFITEAPKGKLTDRMSPELKERETFKPIKLIKTPKDELVFDMGQEFTGNFELTIDEPAGTKIHVQTGEILQEGCFYNENLRSAKSEYYFVTDGGKKTIRPMFTFFGYRFVKIEGVSNLKIDDFKGVAYYSTLPTTGEITTGHKLLNKFISNVKWGLQSNFVDVPTDCPQRDERMGWTGDAQVFSATATYLKDTYAFYTKYLYDMALEQSTRDGKVCDVIPSFGVESTACVWGDAATINALHCKTLQPARGVPKRFS